jgi:hypothetical protein
MPRASKMMKHVFRARRSTLGGDKNDDTLEHVKALRALGVTPHVAQNDRNRRSEIDERTTGHAQAMRSAKGNAGAS